MDCLDSMEKPESPYELLLRGLLLIPTSHYLVGILVIYLTFLYNFLQLHFFQDLFSGFRGQPVSLTFNPNSELYREVISKCHLLHGRFLSTPWLCSPHFQTLFLRFFGRPPLFSYRRELFIASDGGTVALDWVNILEVEADSPAKGDIQKNDNVPIVVVIPGLTSDSYSVYIKHVSFYLAKQGWNVVVSNHRGLGGIPLTSDFFYNGGWTEDMRQIVLHLRGQSQESPIYIVGTSLGANMMVKYIGEDGADIPIAGAVAVCCPWDLLQCDRFIRRKFTQRLYDRALGFGLKSYAKKHKELFARLANWEGIEKSCSVRDFDTSGTCRIAKYETADAYYRAANCVNYVKGVKVPLLGIGAMDDPVCTNEAIIWDECRTNENVILATTEHGGHLGHFEGLAAKSLWWVKAVDEFLTVLNSSPIVPRKMKMQVSAPISSLESRSKQAHVPKHESEPTKSNETTVIEEDAPFEQSSEDEDIASHSQKGERGNFIGELPEPSEKDDVNKATLPLTRFINRVFELSRRSDWMLACAAVLITLPLARAILRFFVRKKFGSAFRMLKRRIN